ncbi:MAG: hypothetical protein SGILL_009736 [Bacillariaceae sp.]
MLSGIKTGKKKKKSKPSSLSDVASNLGASAPEAPSSTGATKINGDANLSAAERLKQALAQGIPLQNSATSTSSNEPVSYMDRVIQSSSTRGKIGNGDNIDSSFVVLDAPGTARYAGKREEDMTVSELAAKERTMAESSMSWNEHIARDVVRVGKKRKLKSKTAAAQDSDEEVEQMKKHLPDNQDMIKKSAKQLEKEQQRERKRQISQYQKQEKITSMCSWWINSSNFDKHRLLAFGKHVSLMMAPLNASLVPGHHFYLVPLKHAPSFVDCDDEGVWEEVKLFRTSLEKMYARQGKGVVLVETVLPNKGFWQTKMEAIPVPFSSLQDAPIYFKSSMIEQADEDDGTHKLLKTSVQKPLKALIPKKFPYFYIDWGNIATSSSTGYAQSSNFRQNFGLDTLAGMMELDPVRLQRKRKFPPGTENDTISEFQSKWSAVDWTLELENDV